VTRALIDGISDVFRRFARPASVQPVKVVATTALGPGTHLAVVAFGERHLLLAVGKSGVALIAECAA